MGNVFRRTLDEGDSEVRVLSNGKDAAERITNYGSEGAWARKLGEGSGDSHVNVVHFEPGGEIGPHRAGFDQLFIVADGSGWAAGEDGIHVSLRSGQSALIRRGEIHSKGSDSGMVAILVQADEFTVSE